VVAKALEKDPDRRYRSAAEMLAALPQPKQAFPGDGRLPPGRPYAGDVPPENGSKKHLAETIVLAQTADDEPVVRTLRQAKADFYEIWLKFRQKNKDTPQGRITLLAVYFSFIVFAVCFGIQIAITVIVSFVLYWFYRLIRKIVLPRRGPTSVKSSSFDSPNLSPAQGTAGINPNVAAVHDQRKQELRAARKRFEKAIPALVLGTPRERIAELLGSLLLSALVAAAMTVVMVLISGFEVHDPRQNVPRPEQCVWLFLITIAGAWTVLIPSKLWEGTYGDTTLRRFAMTVLGLGLGGLAYLMANMFMVTLPPSPHFAYPNYALPQGFYSFDGQPMLKAFLSCFGASFFILRWWLQADPLRRKRLRIWSVLVTVLATMIIAYYLDFPQPWLPMVAGAISVTVQLSSPWAHPGKQGRKT
jgi:hypothetical protein